MSLSAFHIILSLSPSASFHFWQFFISIPTILSSIYVVLVVCSSYSYSKHSSSFSIRFILGKCAKKICFCFVQKNHQQSSMVRCIPTSSCYVVVIWTFLSIFSQCDCNAFITRILTEFEFMVNVIYLIKMLCKMC